MFGLTDVVAAIVEADGISLWGQISLWGHLAPGVNLALTLWGQVLPFAFSVPVRQAKGKT